MRKIEKKNRVKLAKKLKKNTLGKALVEFAFFRVNEKCLDRV